MGNLSNALNILFNFIEVLILIRIVLSFFRINLYSSIGRIVYELTEPILSPSRELIYRLGINTGMFDFSPVVAIIMLRVISGILQKVLH